MMYALINKDDGMREGILLKAKTDERARQEAEVVAEKCGIKNYSIIFYNPVDGCRGLL